MEVVKTLFLVKLRYTFIVHHLKTPYDMTWELDK